MSDFFQTRVENLKPREKKKKSSVAAKKCKDKKFSKKRKREDSYSSAVESSKDYSVSHKPVK